MSVTTLLARRRRTSAPLRRGPLPVEGPRLVTDLPAKAPADSAALAHRVAVLDVSAARERAAARLVEHGLELVAVTETDWNSMADLVAALGPQGRHARFHGSVGSLGEARARQLAGAEPGRRVGYAAATPEGDFAAHAVLCATAGDGPEFAVMTAPAWQGRGLASTLGALLAEQSRAEGETFWCAEIRGDNAPAFALCAKLGHLERRRWDGGSVHVHVHLPEA